MKIFLCFFCLVSVATVHAKRVAPVAVPPVVYQGVRYLVDHWVSEPGIRQKGGYLQAVDEKTGKKLWGRFVYLVRYSEGRERDIQDVFITGVRLEGGALLVRNESGHLYRVELQGGRVYHLSGGR